MSGQCTSTLGAGGDTTAALTPRSLAPTATFLFALGFYVGVGLCATHNYSR
eukprot:COSAG02_NODE_55182_length_292_cov_0.538860_1_plen_50_part_10